MIRVLRERCDLEQQSEPNRYGETEWVVKASGVPCEMIAQSSAEKNDRGVAVTTDYLWVTRTTIIPSTQTNWRIIWRGRTWTVQGFLEDHYLHGRLQHREGVVRQAAPDL